MQKDIRPNPRSAASSRRGTPPPAASRPAGRRRWLLLAILLGALPGCYTYHVTDMSSLEPGEEVRVQVGTDQFVSSGFGSTYLGPRRLEGRFAEVTPDSLIVSLWVGSAYRGTPFESARQNLGIAISDVAQVENRQLNRTRTMLAAAGTLGVIWYMIDGLGLLHNTGMDEGEDPWTPPDQEPLSLLYRMR